MFLELENFLPYYGKLYTSMSGDHEEIRRNGSIFCDFSVRAETLNKLLDTRAPELSLFDLSMSLIEGQFRHGPNSFSS